MSLDPDILSAIQESISAIIKPLADGLDKVNHDNSKLSQAIADISNNVSQKLSTIDPIAEYVEKLKSQQEEQPPSTTSSHQPQIEVKEPTKLDKEIAKVRAGKNLPFEANAALISAAPDLLAALEQIASIDFSDSQLEEVHSAISKARSAISKAKGERNA